MDISNFAQAPSDVSAFEDTFRFAAFTIARLLGFSAHAIIFGLVPLLIIVIRPTLSSLQGAEWGRGRSRLATRLEGLVQASLVASALITALTVTLQGALIAQATGGAFSLEAILDSLETTFGQWHFLRFPLLAALAVLLVGKVRRAAVAGAGDEEPSPRWWWWGAWAGLGLILLLSSTMSGHAVVASPTAVSIANDLLHLAAGGVWFTGIVVLALVLPETWRAVEPARRLEVLAPAVARFATVAAVAIGVLAATGTLNSFLHVGRWSDLIETGYGRTLGLKILLFFAVLALGALNHFVLRDRLQTALQQGKSVEAARQFRKTIAAELMLGLALMGITGLLVGLARTREITTVPEGGDTAVVNQRP